MSCRNDGQPDERLRGDAPDQGLGRFSSGQMLFSATTMGRRAFDRRAHVADDADVDRNMAAYVRREMWIAWLSHHQLRMTAPCSSMGGVPDRARDGGRPIALRDGEGLHALHGEKAMIGGWADEVIDLANTNLWLISRGEDAADSISD
jgi:hypothetical protein